MADAEVFLDTAGLLALIRARDGLHADAQRVMATLKETETPLVTSQWVLAEFLGGTARPPLRLTALRFVEALSSSPHTTVVPATADTWAAALDLYAARTDKEWSFVDCSSIAICNARGIRRVLTHDRDFEQAGFETLLR